MADENVADGDLLAALVAEVMKKTALCWVSWPGSEREHPVWHTWQDGAAYLLSGGDEQPLPGIDQVGAGGGTVTVIARTKDSRERIVAWRAKVETIGPQHQDWPEAVRLLQAERLNLTDSDTVEHRWARECTISRLTPTGEFEEQPGRLPDGSLAAVPLPTPATTRGPLPRVLHRRQTHRPPLS